MRGVASATPQKEHTMHLQPMSFGELMFRNPYETPADYCCAVCEQVITEGPVWTCDDHDLVAADALLCTAFYFCATCATDEGQIRQTIRDTAADYDADDRSRAEVLRRMAESPLVRGDGE
jgi:hypothetical protein